jgi:glyoxylase-like metal-dependent hydrolase (beta-lactamase superfamily II)
VVRRGGNILVDSPRFATPLVEKIAALGGIRWMFLTHRDDVADHAQFRERFGCDRILHRSDVSHATRGVELKLEGEDPIVLDDEVRLVPVPGHTRGSTCLLYRERFLFSGDHAWWDPRKKRIHASKSVCWYDWEKQIASMEWLMDYRFEWLLPGHGTRCRLPEKEMAAEVAAIVHRMKRS